MNDNRAGRGRRELRRAVSRHRRLLAAGLAAAAVALTVTAVRPPPAATTAVLVADHDLAGGLPLGRGDLTAVSMPPGLVPAGAVRPPAELTGAVLAGPVRQGEVLTDARLVGPGLLGSHLGSGGEVVATPVRLADAEAARLVRVGDVVDVLAAGARPEDATTEAPARVVARRARVLAVPRPADDGRAFSQPQPSDGALIVLETTPEVAAALARAAVIARLSVTIRYG